MDKKRHLPQVERVVLKGEFGIFAYGVYFLLCVGCLSAQGVGNAGIGRCAIRVVIFLEHVAQIEIAVFFVGHHSVVAPVFFQQLRVIIIASRIEGLLLYLFKVGLLDLYLPLVFRSLRLGGTFGCRYVAALLRLGAKGGGRRCEEHEDEYAYGSCFHGLTNFWRAMASTRATPICITVMAVGKPLARR